MLIIKFNHYDKKITWLIDNAVVFFLVYILTSLFLAALLLYLKLKKKKKNLNTLPRGGSDELLPPKDLLKCIKDKESYIIKSKRIFEAVRHILKLDKNKKVVVINRAVFVLAILQANDLGSVLRFGLAGLHIITDNWLNLMLTVVYSVVSATAVAAILNLVGVSSLLISAQGFLVPLLIWASSNFDCTSVLQKLPQVQASQQELHYVETSNPDKENLLILKPDEAPKLYYKVLHKSECEITKVDSPQLVFADLSGEELVPEKAEFREKCKNTEAHYEPINEKTNSLEDVKRGDSSERLQEMNILLSDGNNHEKGEISSKLNNKNQVPQPSSNIKTINKKYGSLNTRTKTLNDLDIDNNDEIESYQQNTESDFQKAEENKRLAEKLKN